MNLFKSLQILFTKFVFHKLEHERKYFRIGRGWNYVSSDVAATHQSFKKQRRRRFIVADDWCPDRRFVTVGLVRNLKGGTAHYFI